MIGIDPGTTESGWVVLVDRWHREDDMRVISSGVSPNDDIIRMFWPGDCEETPVAIEMIASYGMPVGREVFETCEWIGRFRQAASSCHPENTLPRLVYRKDVKMHLCGTPRAKDANVRQALIDRFPRSGGGKVPQIGTKSKPGPLYGVTSHAWAALGVALTALETDP